MRCVFWPQEEPANITGHDMGTMSRDSIHSHAIKTSDNGMPFLNGRCSTSKYSCYMYKNQPKPQETYNLRFVFFSFCEFPVIPDFGYSIICYFCGFVFFGVSSFPTTSDDACALILTHAVWEVSPSWFNVYAMGQVFTDRTVYPSTSWGKFSSFIWFPDMLPAKRYQ